jgi:hypothetical protein
MISREEAQYQVEIYWVDSLKNAVIDGDTDFGSLIFIAMYTTAGRFDEQECHENISG